MQGVSKDIRHKNLSEPKNIKPKNPLESQKLKPVSEIQRGVLGLRYCVLDTFAVIPSKSRAANTMIRISFVVFRKACAVVFTRVALAWMLKTKTKRTTVVLVINMYYIR